MKKVSIICFLILFSVMLTSCENSRNVENAAHNEIVYQGEYVTNDGDVLSVTEQNGEFGIKIDVIRLTCIDDGIGKISSSNDELEFSATDANGNPIFGSVYWKNQNEVILEFTKSTWDYLPEGTVFKFCRGKRQKQTEEVYEEEVEINKAPVAPIRFDVLDNTFTGYRNRTGATFFEKKDQNSLVPYYLKITNDVRYFYGTNEAVVGIKNDEVCLFTGVASDVVGHTSPQVREMINALDADVLFEILPKACEVKNSYNSQCFYYWEIENGYIGFVVLGEVEIANCYDRIAYSLVLFEELDTINIVAVNE